MDNGRQATPNKNSRWPQIEQALEAYYSGQATSLIDAVESVENLGRSTFYKYRDEYAEEFALLETRVQIEAVQERRGIEQAFAREQLEISMRVQREASQAAADLLPTWMEIARGDVRTVRMPDGKDKAGNDKTTEKKIIPYPRDMLEAAKLIVSVARDGLRPEHGQALAGTQPIQAEEPKQLAEPETKEIALIPGLVASDFDRVTATLPDGTVVHASVQRPVDVIDIEPEQ